MTKTFSNVTGKRISTEIRVRFRVSGAWFWSDYVTQVIVNDHVTHTIAVSTLPGDQRRPDAPRTSNGTITTETGNGE